MYIMGSVLFDYLTESFLFDEAHLEDAFARIDEKQLADELKKYREFCLQHLAALRDEVVASPSMLRAFTGVARLPVRTLKQSALYVEQYVLEDPLFSFTPDPPVVGEAMRGFFGAPPKTIDREDLVSAIRYVRELTPMVAANYVKFLPVSYLFEPPRHLPVHYSDNYFDDVLPRKLLKFYHDRAVVRRLERAGEGWRICDDLQPCRSISIHFENHDSNQCYVQHLFEQEVLHMDEDTRIVDFRLHLPKELPDEPYFKAWVRQSMNRAAQDFHHRISTEIALAGDMAASYLSTSQFAFDVLEHLGHKESEEKQDCTASTLLKLELPFLDNINIENLMRVRENEADAFQAFRRELDKQLIELRLETDPARFQTKARKIVVDLGEAQTSSLHVKAKELQRGALSQSVMLSAVLAGSMWALNATPFAPVAAAAGIAKAVFDYRAAVRSSPGYFLWKVLNH